MKTMTKKVTAVFLAGLMCCNLTACGEKSEIKKGIPTFEEESDTDSNINIGDATDDLIDASPIPDNDDSDDSFSDTSSTLMDDNADGVVEYREMSMTQIAEQCAECEEAVSIYSAWIADAYTMLYDYESTYDDSLAIRNRGEQLYDVMNHSCSSDIIYVEGVPYSIYGSYGFYTGYWQGSAPTGNGSYVGNDIWKGEPVSYDGEWAHGLPEGYGHLYIRNYDGAYWDMDYYGYMYKGLRHGEGICTESGYGKMNAYGTDAFMERIYEKTVFENNVMIYETDYEEYYDGVFNGYGTMCAGEIVSKRDAVEMSASEILGYAVGLTALTVGLFAVINADFSVDYETPYEYTPEGLAEWRANKEAERNAELERQQAEEEKNRQWHEDKYYECIDNGDTSSWDYEYHKNMSGH